MTECDLRVLIVDRDRAVQRVVSDHFEEHGVAVVQAASRAEATGHLAGRAAFDLVLLDLLPGPESGLDLLRDLRATRDIPVILTTAHRVDEIDRVIGLELGADDYVVKPFGLHELLARVRGVLRRVKARPPLPAAEAPRSRFAGWVLDQRRRRLINPQGEPVELTKGEYALLVAFLDAPERPLSREHLLQATRMHEDIYDRSVDVQILRLRRKIEDDPSRPEMIVTERGVGYIFAVPVERSAR